QLQDKWCWAATAVSVASFFEPNTQWTQCAMANAEMGQTTCCVDGWTLPCDRFKVLDRPLCRAEVLDHKQEGSIDYDAIRGEIGAGRPLASRVGGEGGGGHFAVIEGYRSDGPEWVAIDDPLYGPSDVTLSSLLGGTYQGSGRWTHTYFTRPRPPTPP